MFKELHFEVFSSQAETYLLRMVLDQPLCGEQLACGMSPVWFAPGSILLVPKNMFLSLNSDNCICSCCRLMTTEP